MLWIFQALSLVLPLANLKHSYCKITCNSHLHTLFLYTCGAQRETPRDVWQFLFLKFPEQVSSEIPRMP